MTRFNSGLVGTEREASFFGAPGVWTVNEQTLLKGRSLWPRPDETTDPYIGYVSLLLKMNGANGSTVFTDSSLYSNTVTANGNAQISTTQSMFDGASGVFDGSGDSVHISSPPPALIDWWTGDFTIEYWIRATSFTQAGHQNSSVVVGNMSATTTVNYWSFGPISNGTVRFFYYNGAEVTLNTATALSINTWYHLAFVKNGTGLAIYIDGVSSATGTVSGTPQSSTTTNFCIGQFANTSFNGYIDELRITKNIGRYVSTFQPRTTPFPTTTSNTGDLYYPSVSLLLHMDGSNGSTTFADNSSNAFVPTVNGNASISTTDSMFGGASGIFDGTGDYISFADNAAFELGSDDFTIEFWMKTVQERQSATIIARDDSSFGSGSWVLMFNRASSTSGEISVFTGAFSNSVALLTTSGVNIRDGQWHHVAWVRSGTNHYLFVDGIQRASRLSTSLTISDMTVRLYIGADFYLTGRDYSGSLDELRFTKGIARYVSAFTPPSVPFSNSL